MLKVSSRGHYGLRLMTELARANGQGPLSLSEVARVEGLPLPYLEQLVGPLRKAGLVEGTRGLHGGYRLTRPAREMTVGEVLRVLEGPISLVDCTADAYVQGSCDREAACQSSALWQRIKVTVEAILDGTTLDDLMFDPGFAPGMPQLPGTLERLPLATASALAPAGQRSNT
ncbi:MAG: Rrf2 family transcriptional regulator [Candidatus Dormibacteraeota bacterium]|nr:Rrf2 family transcriptional regulator [Candidatus Dormibacteraeota bacterium]